MIRGTSPNLLVLGLILGATHCSRPPEQPRPAEGLGGTSWRLVKFEGGDGTVLTPDDRAKYTLTFDTDGRLSARIDCNRGRGTWTSAEPPQLEFGPLALTRAMCPPGSLHDQIVKQWPYVRSYVIERGHLFLSLMADGGIYEFEPADAAEPAESLENTYWKLMSLGGDSVTVAPGQGEPHLIFNSATGRVAGSGGCNQLGGTYELDGDRLSLGSVIATLMACPEGMETEKAFLEALQRVQGWRITGRQLDLLDAEGDVIGSFEARHME